MHKYMELTREEIKAMTLDEARRLVDENGWTDRRVMYRECRQLYNWCYRIGAFEWLYGDGEAARPDMNRGSVVYDITRVLPYLERWAEEENTTIRNQAGKYGYGKLWLEWCQENGVDVNTTKIDLENEKEK